MAKEAQKTKEELLAGLVELGLTQDSKPYESLSKETLKELYNSVEKNKAIAAEAEKLSKANLDYSQHVLAKRKTEQEVVKLKSVLKSLKETIAAALK